LLTVYAAAIQDRDANLGTSIQGDQISMKKFFTIAGAFSLAALESFSAVTPSSAKRFSSDVAFVAGAAGSWWAWRSPTQPCRARAATSTAGLLRGGTMCAPASALSATAIRGRTRIRPKMAIITAATGSETQARPAARKTPPIS
jgi:hypothetical protein